MDMYKPNDMSLRDRITSLERRYIGDWAAKEVSIGNTGRYIKNTVVAGLAAFYLLTAASCGSLNNYTLNGVPLDKDKRTANSGQTATDAGSKEEKSWWSKNWPYVVGAVVVGGAVAYIISQDDDGPAPTAPPPEPIFD